MKIEEKLRNQKAEDVWQEHCGFLDVPLKEYMKIQNRLMEEQIRLWGNCELGQKFLHGEHPVTIDEFCKIVPLTDYADYADLLLQKREDALPVPPVIWIKTTWEGGIVNKSLAHDRLRRIRLFCKACVCYA